MIRVLCKEKESILLYENLKSSIWIPCFKTLSLIRRNSYRRTQVSTRICRRNSNPSVCISYFIYTPPHMVGQTQDDQHENASSTYVRIQDVALKTCRRRWTIGRSGERGSGISIPATQHDDDTYIYIYILAY